MIVNRDFEADIRYDKDDAIVEFMAVNWIVVPDRFSVPNGYTRVARAGRYNFYANIYDAHERPRYCVINPNHNKEV